MKPEAIRKVIAYHEAGHAVVARLLGQPLISVTIDIENDNTGVLRESAAHAAREGDPAAQIAGCEIDAKVALAGPLAQLKSRPSRNSRHAPAIERHEEDYAHAQSAVAHIALLKAGMPVPEPGAAKQEITLNGAVAESYQATLEKLKRETKALLDEHWAAVKRVAKALFERDRLDQRELDRLMAGAG
jgi:hypothetical protein